MRILVYLLISFFTFSSYSQVLVINEIDANDPSVDDEEFIEIKSQTANFSTDGYILVFFNGNDTSVGNNLSYLTLDLDGLVTDSNGLLVLGNRNVSPFPQILLNDGLFQNGPDGVAIYQTSPSNFPGDTPATTSFNLIDALVYDTGSNSAVDQDLLDALGETTQYFEGSNTTRSIQRQSDGTYVSATPTPRQLNDGSGIVFNPIEISTTATEFNEGEAFTITFTAQQNVTSDVTFNISLSSGTFTVGDFTGSTNVTIPNGQSTASTIITLTDDVDDEGDEELEIQFLDLVEPIVASNNFIIIRVVDNDFSVAPWNLPTEENLGIVQSTEPAGYYDSLIGKSGNDLRQAIQDIIADENVVRTHSYADVIDILKEADQNPENSNQVWLVYTEEGRSKLDLQTSSFSAGKWNREHTFPRSRAGYDDWEDFDDFATGINTFISTNADSLRHGNSDAHALRAADASENSRRSNRHYSNNFDSDEYNGSVGTLGSFKGDVARGVLYLDLRYNGLQIVDGFPSSSPTGNLGDLATLLQWHANDAPDDYEMNRNNVIYNWQRNRNPLIDLPDLVDYIWGSRVGEVWNGALSTEDREINNLSLYPNPTAGKLYINGANVVDVEAYSIDGKLLKRFDRIENYIDLDLASGLYLIKLISDNSAIVRRVVIE
ncbi:MAG: T9SS C-terminal target domain-containing protein [Winogradskyella sp.]|uniref:endonuclease n=1 Tax=Winogradskyella sp. TaxID=1883156 RepID=UPI000F3E1574|nr:endonuclease [Winogradskyella sp.]RNC86722.1 MAG: T9SS C-terminal target domain-containing protein [Winogradskyella sp.]